jgi:deoxyribose-phosphate aldolase
MYSAIAKMIDHTVLKANTTDQQIEQLCEEAVKYGFASVCINPGFIPLAVQLLKGSQVKVCTVIGFPLGANTSDTKLFEAENALRLGARELDYVINVSHVLNGRMDLVEQEMKLFAGLRSDNPSAEVIKVILETCYLSEEQIVKVCELAKDTGLDFVKTSTGFGPAGALAEHVRLMRRTVGSAVAVKASGGIRTYEDAAAMIEAGAARIGTSAGVEIMKSLRKPGKE